MNKPVKSRKVSPGENYYYELALNSKTKKQRNQRRVTIRHRKYNLTEINRILNTTLKNLRVAKNQKSKKRVEILFLLDKIIPNEYFGTVNNRKVFYQVVKKILTQSCFECIHSGTITKGYCYDHFHWMQHISNLKTRQGLLMKTNVFLLDNIVKPLIRFYYKLIRTLKTNEIKFVRLEEWISFKTRVFNYLKKEKFVTEVEDSRLLNVRGYLQIHPKKDLQLIDGNFRAVVSKFRENNNEHFSKEIISKIYKAALDMKKEYMTVPLFDAWRSFVDRVQGKKIYGIKLDVKDAYGKVDIPILTKLISGLSDEFLTIDRKRDLIKHVQQQFVYYDKSTFQWNHGLLQGDTLSPCLCELYMSHLDKTYISQFKSQECFIHRTVDDYFFCSSEEYIVEKFQRDIENVHEVNKSKTITNLYVSNVACIPYCGHLFNLNTYEVKTLFHFDGDFEIRHKFKIWNVKQQFSDTSCKEFLKNAMTYSFSSNNFSSMVMNTVFNSHQIVLENFFDGMIYVAYKLDVVVMTLRNNSFIENFDFIRPVLEFLCKDYAIKVFRKIKKCRGENYEDGLITVKLLEILAYKAFILVFKRRNEIYKKLIEEIEKVHKFKINNRRLNINLKYFNIIPSRLKTPKIARKNVL